MAVILENDGIKILTADSIVDSHKRLNAKFQPKQTTYTV